MEVGVGNTQARQGGAKACVPPCIARADLMEIIDDRAANKATIITSQLPIEHWHAWMGVRSADSIGAMDLPIGRQEKNDDC